MRSETCRSSLYSKSDTIYHVHVKQHNSFREKCDASREKQDVPSREKWDVFCEKRDASRQKRVSSREKVATYI